MASSHQHSNSTFLLFFFNCLTMFYPSPYQKESHFVGAKMKWIKNEMNRAALRGFIRSAYLSECRLSPSSELWLGLFFLTLCVPAALASLLMQLWHSPSAKVAALLSDFVLFSQKYSTLLALTIFFYAGFFSSLFFFLLKVRYLAIDFILANTVLSEASASCQSWSVSATHTEIILKSDLQSL